MPAVLENVPELPAESKFSPSMFMESTKAESVSTFRVFFDKARSWYTLHTHRTSDFLCISKVTCIDNQKFYVYVDYTNNAHQHKKLEKSSQAQSAPRLKTMPAFITYRQAS